VIRYYTIEVYNDKQIKGTLGITG